jgi:hypothetical protein
VPPSEGRGASGSTDEIQPVMSMMARFIAAKLEMSTTTIWFGVTRKGLPCVLMVDAAALNLAVLRIQLPLAKFTVSAPKPKSTSPPKRAP